MLLGVYSGVGFSQVELVPVKHPVYDFLKRADLNGWIEGYNSGIIPISRGSVGKYLKEVDSRVRGNDRGVSGNDRGVSGNDSKVSGNDSKVSGNDSKGSGNDSKLRDFSSVDKKLLNDYMVEFGYDISGDLKKSSGILQGGDIFDNDKQRYFYQYADSNVSFFWDVMGWLSQRNSDGDSIGVNAIGLGEFGMRFRGTMFNSVGFYLRLSNGQKLLGENKDVDFARITNPKWNANSKFKDESGNFDTFEGYLRYATKNEWLALTVGREQMLSGYGYTDKMFLSDNSVPLSFIRLDMKYKKLQYFFMYGSLRGDSLGKEIDSKYIVTHRLNVNLFQEWKIGFFESLIIPNKDFNFSFLNPVSFLRSADYAAGDKQSFEGNNAMIGFDMEVKPFKKLAWQGTMLIDDLDFGSLFSNKRNGKPANSNRFGWQTGVIWTDAFYVPNLTAALEYSRLNPFIYTHRTNKAQYSHWTLPLGLQLAPNSDEIALKFNYDITHRLNFQLKYQHQRHGEGFIFNGDTLKTNYGGTLNRGDGDIIIDNTFLQGNRIDRDMVTARILWQPIRQIYFEGNLVWQFHNLLYADRKLRDLYWWFTVSVN